MGWTMLYLFVFLKLPIVAACWIVWWAVHQDTEPEAGAQRRRLAAAAGRIRARRAAPARRAAAVRTPALASPRLRGSAR